LLLLVGGVVFWGVSFASALEVLPSVVVGDGCGWNRMVANLFLWVNGGLGAGEGSSMCLQELGVSPVEDVWDVGCCVLFG